MRAESAKAAGLRKRILGLVREHARLTLGERRFIPGESLVHYAGRVYDEEEVAALADSSLDFWLTHGPLAARFEKGLAKFLGLPHALLVNSGSSANLLAVSALRSPLLDDPLRPGDEVITPALTFPTTLAPILQNGLVPVFVDVDPATYCLDASRLEAALSPKTRAIFLPHTLGNPCDMRTVLPLVKEKGLYLIEDACDALGASFDGRHVGTLGDAGTVSFYPAHHMTLGEGGAVFTGNGRLKRALASLRDWGRDCWCDSGKSDTCGRRFGWKLGLLPEGYDHKYIYSHVGYNLKALDLQAAIGLEQLKKLPGFIRSRNANFARLKKGLSPFSDVLRLPETYPGAEPSWFAMPLTVREDAPFTRRDIVGHLEGRRIETRMLFAGNILKQPAYCAMPHRVAGGLDNTDTVMERSFFVGVFPGLVPEALDYMVDCFSDFIRKAKAKPLLALLLAFALRLPAQAADRWSEPFAGVRYLHRTTSSPKHSIHAAVIDLSAPGVRIVATSPEGKRSTVSSFAGRMRAQVAVNGDFFNLDTRVPICYAMGEGTHWPGTADTERCGQVAAGGSRVAIVPPAADFRLEPWMREVVSGHPMLLRDGAVLEHKEGSSLAQSRHPRTAVGLSRDQKTLFLLVVDGRQDHSVGMTAAEEAGVLKELGAWDALNFDGGGSSAMYIAGRGIVNRPSDGQERLDANHLGVYASSARPGTREGASEGGSSTTGPGPSTPPSGNSGAGNSSSAGAGSGTSGGGSSTASSGSSASSSGSSATAGSSSTSTSGAGQAEKTSSPGAGSGGSDLLPGMAGALALARKGAVMTAYQARVLRRANKVAESDIEGIMRAAIAQPWKDPASGLGPVRRGPSAPVQGKISRGFGPSEDILLPPRPSNGVVHPHFHGGVDIAAPEGTQVKAFDLGRVAFVGVSEGAGVHVVLAHPGGLASAYTHLAKGPHTSGLKVGQYVNAGQVIGQVGRTGVAASPHLHFMLSRGWLIDPVKHLRAR